MMALTHCGDAPGLLVGHAHDICGAGVEEEVARAFFHVEFCLEEETPAQHRRVTCGQARAPHSGPRLGRGEEGAGPYLDARMVVDGHFLWDHPHILHQNEVDRG